MPPEATHALPASDPPRTELAVSGMTCQGCARKVTDALQRVPEVTSAWVSLERHQASVRWKPGVAADPTALLQAVQKAGFQAHVHTADSSAPSEAAGKERLWSANVATAIVGTAVLMAGEWIFGMGDRGWYRWLSFALAAVVQFGPGRQFYRGAWNQIRVGSSNMDTLVALGSTTAFAYSVWVLLSGASAHLYFMEAAAIISLVSAGHWMEARVGAKASGALRDLMQLAPATARRRLPDGTERDVPVADLRAGDTVVLKPGDQVPVDGVVLAGASTVNEAMLTGESLSVDKAAGATLYTGTSNLTGQLLLQVTSTGEQTALAHVIEAVRRAQTSRANIQRLGDRVSSIFVPCVVLAAIGTALWWGLWFDPAHRMHESIGRYLWTTHPPASPLAAAVVAAAAVLIIACPCAMGLATPAAIMAGANAAARRGILIRDGVALEKAGCIDTLLFDKTGTLTLGRPEVADTLATVVDPDKRSLIELAAALAQPSGHPLSQAVASLASARVEWVRWQERPGSGVEAIHPASGLEVLRLGSLGWLAEVGVDLAGSSASWIDAQSGAGATVLGLAKDSRLLLLMALRDQLKPEATRVVEELARHRLSVHLVTGDRRATAASIAQRVGIPADHVFAEVRPADKAALVQRLQAQGRAVAFVGDGINDAPALEQADLGIAVTRASDIAREAADIVLLRSNLEAVPESLALAKATLATIRQNLFWAFFYNALGIPLAALGFMSPVLCALAMGLSDLIVIGNALRLLRWSR